MKTIIACTDFSPSANNAVQYAAAFAQAASSRLVLFHHFVYPVPATDLPLGFPSVFVDEMAANLEHRLQDLKAELVKTYPITIDCVVRSWDFTNDLEGVFQSENADLVVMGMQGQSALLNAILGGVSSASIRRGKLPLLMVPRGVAFHPFKKIIFPCDDQEIKNPGIVQPLVDLASVFDAYIEVLTLFNEAKTPAFAPKANRPIAKSNLDLVLAKTRHGYAYETDIEVAEGIIYEAARSTADLVAMIPHHHSIWANFLNLSSTQRVAQTIGLPLLVLGENLCREAPLA